MTILMMALIFVVMYMVLLRGPRKQQQQQKQMVQSLKKNDRVRTIGGIYGTVMDVKGDEVVLKIDEATNTKIHVSVSAIGKNLSQDTAKNKSEGIYKLTDCDLPCVIRGWRPATVGIRSHSPKDKF